MTVNDLMNRISVFDLDAEVTVGRDDLFITEEGNRYRLDLATGEVERMLTIIKKGELK